MIWAASFKTQGKYFITKSYQQNKNWNPTKVKCCRTWHVSDSCYPVKRHHVEKKLLTFSLFSEATSLLSYTGSRRRDWLTDWLTDRSGCCPHLSTDAFDMTGPAMSSLAVQAWLDQVIARMKDWVLLSTWHIRLTHLSSPPPASQLPNLGRPFVIHLLRRESRFKDELPSSSFLPPRCWTPYRFSAPRKLVALQGFPSILRELLPHDFSPMSVCELQAVSSLSSSCSRLIPTDKPVSTSEAFPLRMADEVLVKINMLSPLHPHLRRHAKKNHLHLHRFCRCQYFKHVLSQLRWQRIFYSLQPSLFLMRQARDVSQRWFWKAVLYCHGLTYSLKTVSLINHLSPFMWRWIFLSPPCNRCDEFN